MRSLPMSEGLTHSKSYRNGPTKLNLAHTISLDTAVLSGSKFGLQKLGFCILLITLVGKKFLKSLNPDSLDSSAESGGNRDASTSSKSLSLQTMIKSLLKSFEVIAGGMSSKITSSIDIIKGAASSMFGRNGEESIKLDDWSVCKLQQRESLYGGRYTRYQFELENIASRLPLYIGQEVSDAFFCQSFRSQPCQNNNFLTILQLQIVMCSTDSKGRILKENFFSISSSATRGSFEILVKRNTGAGSYDKFVRSLDGLEQGDEIAFKGGSYRLNYEGTDDPIKYVTVVSSSIGIAPSLQILNGILSDRDSTVEDMELLWMNSDTRDFVCEKDVVALENKYEKKLFVTRVNEAKLFEQDFTKKDVILGALSAYESGRIAVLCGSDDMISKMKDLLINVGYPIYSVIEIPT